jgi:hypothetical protein
MKNQTILTSKFLCYMALCFCSLWTLIFIVRVLRFANIITFNLAGASDVGPVVWIENASATVTAIQWIELIGYVVTTAIMIAILFTFILKLLKGLKSDQVFTRSNTRLLFALAATSFFFELFLMNKHIISGMREIHITSELFITPTIILLVAMLYSLAVKAAEENKLTI